MSVFLSQMSGLKLNRSFSLLVFCSFIFITYFHLQAKAELDEVISFHEFLKLEPEQKEFYLAGLTQLMIELEDIEIESRELRAPSLSKKYQPGFPILVKSTGKVACPGFLPGSKVRMKPYLMNFKKDKRLAIQWPQDPKNFLCASVKLEQFTCPKGFVPGQAKWNRTDSKGQKEGKRFYCFSENHFQTVSASAQKYMQRNLSEELQYIADIKAANVKVREKEKQKKAVNESQITTTTLKSTSEVVSSEIEHPKECSSESINEAREKFYRGPGQLCIYGGNLSQYKDKVKRKGGCQPPNSFCFDSLNCQSSGDKKITPQFSCDADQVICNPLIFGIQEDGVSPFCVSRGENATLDCSSISEDPAKSFQALLNYKTGSNLGLMESWNEFKNELINICKKDKNSALFFCRECLNVKNRLTDLNLALRESQKENPTLNPRKARGSQ